MVEGKGSMNCRSNMQSHGKDDDTSFGRAESGAETSTEQGKHQHLKRKMERRGRETNKSEKGQQCLKSMEKVTLLEVKGRECFQRKG